MSFVEGRNSSRTETRKFSTIFRIEAAISHGVTAMSRRTANDIQQNKSDVPRHAERCPTACRTVSHVTIAISYGVTAMSS